MGHVGREEDMETGCSEENTTSPNFLLEKHDVQLYTNTFNRSIHVRKNLVDCGYLLNTFAAD